MTLTARQSGFSAKRATQNGAGMGVKRSHAPLSESCELLLTWFEQRGPAVPLGSIADGVLVTGGATDDEAARALGWSGDSLRPRRVAMVKRGLIEASRHKRRTGAVGADGKQNRQTVWQISQPKALPLFDLEGGDE